MKAHSASYFCNRDCAYYPCHPWPEGEAFNCLFCFCPLYRLACPGEPKYLPDGTRDCSGCGFPHKKENYKLVIQCLKEAQQRERPR